MEPEEGEILGFFQPRGEIRPPEREERSADETRRRRIEEAVSTAPPQQQQAIAHAVASSSGSHSPQAQTPPPQAVGLPLPPQGDASHQAQAQQEENDAQEEGYRRSAGLSDILVSVPRARGVIKAREIQCKVNMYRLRFNKVLVFHYSLRIDEVGTSRPLKLRAADRLDVMSRAIRGAPLNNYAVIYDSAARNVYTPTELSSEALDFKVVIRETARKEVDRVIPARERTYHIIMTLNNTVDLDALNRGQLTPESLMGVQVANTLMNHIARMKKNLIFGNKQFNPKDENHSFRLRGGDLGVIGHFLSVRPSELGAFLNINTAAVVLRGHGLSLTDYLQRKFGNLRHGAAYDPRPLRKEVLNLKVETKHLAYKRTYTVKGVGRSADEERFECAEFDGKMVTVAEYFGRKYHMRLKEPHQPCLKLGNRNILLPIELLDIAPGQRTLAMKLNPQDETEFRKRSIQAPREKIRLTEDGLPNLRDCKTKFYLDEYQIENSNKMIEVTGRVLPDTTVVYNDNRQERCQNGSWRVQRLTFCETIPEIRTGFIIMDCPVRGGGRSGSVEIIRHWLQGFIRTAQSMNLRITRAENPEHILRPGESPHRAMEDFAAQKCSLVICFTEGPSSPLHAEIKYYGDTVYGIPSQCITVQKVSDPSKSGPPLHNTILQSVNAKLGGYNHYIEGGIVPKGVRAMIMGADVNHPSPGSFGPSIASIVGSYNTEHTKYFTTIRYQESGHEMILDVLNMVKDLLRVYYEQQDRFPEAIILYRDGIGNGYFQEVLDYELEAIRRAMEDIGKEKNQPFSARVTYIVVQKRGGVRVYPSDSRDGDRSGNVPPGTIIDHSIVVTHGSEFYLNPHQSIIGTSIPMHCHTLVDDNNFSADDIQIMTFKLCHVYASCTRSVSIPTPAYYADLAAYRSRSHLNYQEEGRASETTGSSGNHRRRDGVPPNDAPLPKRKILYTAYYL
eukprot:TRINITY_DN2526_c0_g1::TRINITY_DN2526_c0_g1_i1::g.19075::m.19075 TRINITY_DN2526_c0_g1::TRINITY_DN2526_c0_g1_i1::g.19075  ORF type:complete len:957 (-),score=134.01,sp/Q8CJG1/AGO1_MOUSE/31.32/6e-97,Piwi/PF02171.12/4.1e-77,PAZ/PF02170.17/3.9e-20,DUF1785/PF08699.5/0.21 TRINITY_DN2526_c0_g1_i1:462-3332(-)